MMRVVRYLLGGLLVLSIVFALVAWWSITTESGTRMVIAQAQRFLPELHVESVNGSFHEGLQAGSVTYSNPELVLEVRNIVVQVDLWSLLNLEALEINLFKADRIAVRTSGSRPEHDVRDTFKLPELPWVVRVHEAEVQGIVLNGMEAGALVLAGEWDRHLIVVDFLRVQWQDLKVAISGNATVDFARLTVAAEWLLGSDAGRLTAEGSLDDLTVNHIYRGAEEVTSSGKLNLADWPILTGRLAHEIPVRLLSVTTSISGQASEWDVSATGEYREIPFKTEVTINQADDVWHLFFRSVDIAGAAALSGEAAYGDDLTAEILFETRDLARLFPQLSGDCTGQVILVSEEVRIESRCDVVSYADVEVLAPSMRMDLNRFENPTIRSQMTARAIELAGTRLTDPELKVRGTLDALDYSFAWQGANLNGRIVDLSRLHIHAGGMIRLDDFEMSNIQEVIITGEKQRLTVSDHCWQGLGRICLDETTLDIGGSRAAGQTVRLRGSLEDLALHQFNAWLPVDWSETAVVQGEWRSQSEGSAWQISGDFQGTGLTAQVDQREITIPPIKAIVQVSDQGASFKIDGESAGTTISGALELHDLSADPAIQGVLRTTLDLGNYKQLFPTVDSLTGQVSGETEISGRISEPVLRTSGSWRNGRVKIVQPELELTGIQSEWVFDKDRWQIRGTAEPVDGGAITASIDGSGFDQDLVINARVNGSDIPLESDIWQVRTDPDFSISMQESKVTFDGKAAVPFARIEINAVPPSLPRPSADVVVVGRDQSEADGVMVSGAVDVQLGDDVRLKLLGLNAGLKGRLTAKVVGDEVVSLGGELEIYDGSLSASGQVLTVENGRILFTGDPNDPFIDMVAVRKIPDQTPPLKVGLKISGRADDLETTVYSEPTMNETRALSFLVLGRDFNEEADGDSQQLVTAALGFGLKQSQGVVQELRKVLGLDELSALAAAQNDVAIVAGKRITQDLYVRYSYNAISAVGALIVRYYLTDRWRLEVSNDVTSSMDLFYEFTK